MKTRSTNLAIKFAVWLCRSNWEQREDGRFGYAFDQDVKMTKEQYDLDWVKTIDELYESFKIQSRMDGNN